MSELLFPVVFLLIGFALLLIGGEALVRAAVSLAVRTKISPAIISLTIVAAGTSAPELVTSMIAAAEGKPDIAMGNVVGSNVFNILAILGLSFLIKPSAPKNQGLGFEWTALLIFTLCAHWMILDTHLVEWEGLLLVLAFAGLIYISLRNARKKGFTANADDEVGVLKNVYVDFLYLSIGLAALVGGAQLALKGGVTLGQLAGWSEKMIGITIVSVGTGLPELAASAVAAFRGRSDIAIGNVIGSNVMNTLAVLGGAAMVTPLVIDAQIIHIDMWILHFCIILLFPIILGIKAFLGRFSGALLTALYAFYVWGTLNSWHILTP